MHFPPKTSLHLEQNQLLYKSPCSNHFGEPSIFCWVKHPSVLTNKPSHHASTLPTREPYGFIPPISDLPSKDLEQRNTNKIISAEKNKKGIFSLDLCLFPTSLCGVLVFDSVSRAPPPPPPPHTQHTQHTHITHTHHTHTHHTHTYTLLLLHTHTHNTHTSHTHHTHTHHTHITHTQTHTSHTHIHTQTHTSHTTRTHTQHTHTHNTHTPTQHTHTAAFYVAGVALGDIHFRYAWQKVTSTVVLCGRRGTDGTGWHAWTGLGAAVTPVTPRHSAWQAWHLVTSTLISRGRRGTTSHLLSFCVAGVGQMALGGALGLV